MLLSIGSFYIAAFLFYLVDVLQKITSEQIATWPYIFKRSLYSALTAIAITLLIDGFTHFPTFIVFLHFFGASVLCCFGFFFFIRSINTLAFSNAGALFLVGNVLQQWAGILLNNDRFHWLMSVSWLLMSFGTFYHLLFTRWHKGALNVLLSSVCWTMGYIWLSKSMQGQSVLWTVPIMECTLVFISGVIILLTKQWKQQIHNQQHKKYYFWLIALAIYLASLTNHYSYQQNSLLDISFMQLSLIPVIYLLSLMIFREKSTTIQWISVITGFAGFALYVWLKWLGY